MLYVASSWRNEYFEDVLDSLEQNGVPYFNFRNNGFDWAQVNSDFKDVSVEEFKDMLKHPYAVEGFHKDMSALQQCNACLLVMPCGRSAHLELGYCIGWRKPCAIYIPKAVTVEAELMYSMVGDNIFDSMQATIEWAVEAAKVLN